MSRRDMDLFVNCFPFFNVFAERYLAIFFADVSQFQADKCASALFLEIPAAYYETGLSFVIYFLSTDSKTF